MKSIWGMGSFLLALVFVLPAPAADDQKKDDANPPAPAAADKKDQKTTAPDDKPAPTDKKDDTKPATPDKKDDKTPAKDDKKDEKKPDSKEGTPKKTEEDKALEKILGPTDSQEKLTPVGQLTGKIVDVQPTSKTLRLQVTRKIPVTNQGAVDALNNIQVQMRQAALNPNRQDAYNKMRDLQRQMLEQQAKLIDYKDDTQTVELSAADSVQVRIAYPPPAFDDKGNPKQYTPKELRELKGVGNKWGYPADFDTLKTDQTVVVDLGMKKSTGGKINLKDKDLAAGLAGANKPLITTVYILAEKQN